MRSPYKNLKPLTWMLAAAVTVQAAKGQTTNASAVTAELRCQQTIVAAGQSVWVDFLLSNPTDQVVVLYMSGSTRIDLNPTEMGVPIEHIIGSPQHKALSIRGPEGALEPGAVKKDGSQIAIRLRPHGVVGRRVNLVEYFPRLASPGKFRVQWQPYEGAVRSNELVIQVAELRHAIMETDFGSMRVELLYQEAPRHVENFIELVERGFYDNLTFHRIEPGYLIQGGSPDGQPTGVRPDGSLLDPEFNDYPFKRGTIGMARRPSDVASASCQFFICNTDWPELTGKFTAFARVIGEDSLVTLEKLMQSPVDPRGRPLRNIYIREIRLVGSDKP